MIEMTTATTAEHTAELSPEKLDQVTGGWGAIAAMFASSSTTSTTTTSGGSNISFSYGQVSVTYSP